MDVAVQVALNALIAGALYSLAALGFNLLYSTTKFFDLGYGAYAAAGAYAVFFVHTTVGMPLLPALFFGICSAGALGFCVEKIVYKPLRRRRASNTVILIASLGVLTVIQAMLAMIFSSQFESLSRDIGAIQVFDILGGALTDVHVSIMVVAVVTLVALSILLHYTMFGKAIRAISDDEEVAQIVGINSERVVGIVYFLGACMAGVAGIAVGFDSSIQPTMGMAILLAGVVAAIVGGVGNVYGGVLGAFLLAVVENVGVWYLGGSWKAGIAFFILVLFLIVRPQGLLPK